MNFTIELIWNDESKTMFETTIKGKEHEIMGTLMWITRGSLMASGACRATAYNDQGFDVVSYVQ